MLKNNKFRTYYIRDYVKIVICLHFGQGHTVLAESGVYLSPFDF